MILTDLVASWIRTIVPVVVGTAIAVIVKRIPALEDTLKEAEINSWLIPACIAAYYTAVRSLEKKYPHFGWLFGLAKQPGYSDAPPPAPAPQDDPTFSKLENDTIDEQPDTPENEGDDADHDVPPELLALHLDLEEQGITPAAFREMMK